MKKLFTVISLLMLFFANAECTVLYSYDDSGSGGGSTVVSSVSSVTLKPVNDVSAAWSTMVASTSDNSEQFEDLSSEYNAVAAQRAALAAANPSAINISTDRYNSTLALLSNIMKSIWETLQSVLRNML
jgi:hypothetical protein